MLLRKALPTFDLRRHFALMATSEDASATTRELPIRSNSSADPFEYDMPSRSSSSFRPHGGNSRALANADLSSFSIVATYNRLLAEDPDLNMSIAAIEALIEFLGQSEVTTAFETIELVKAQSAKLEQAVRNPIALSHGTELFKKYLDSSLRQQGPGGKRTSAAVATHENFEVVRQHLVRNGRLFAQRAKDARERIAVNGRRHIYDDTTILTYGGSRVVGTLLGRAAEKHDYGDFVDEPIRFKVIYAIDPSFETESNKVVAALRAKDVPVATIPPTAIAYVMEKVDMVVVGAEAVAANGGIFSRLGTYQLAQVAKANRKPFFVAAEQHKFGETFPCGQFDYPFDQGILDFYASKPHTSGREPKVPMDNPIDYTPPEYIECFFADHKVLTTSEVAKEVIDMLVD